MVISLATEFEILIFDVRVTGILWGSHCREQIESRFIKRCCRLKENGKLMSALCIPAPHNAPSIFCNYVVSARCKLKLHWQLTRKNRMLDINEFAHRSKFAQ